MLLRRRINRSQTKIVLMALSLGGYWSVQELENFTAKHGNKSHRIAARVSDLRKQGHAIEGRFRKFPIYEYWMEA